MIICAHRDGAEVWVRPKEFHIKTSDTLSTRTLRGALKIETECTITHKGQYTLLKVKRGVPYGVDNGNEEVGA